MAWGASFLTALKQNYVRICWRVDVVVSNAPGSAWSIASHEDGDADEVRIEDGSVRLSSSSLDPRGWRTTFGGFSFTVIGSVADFVASVTRGTVVTLSAGVDDPDPLGMEVVAIGIVRNIRRVRKGAWEVEVLDGLALLTARLDKAQDNGRLFCDYPKSTTVAGMAYVPGDTSVQVADLTIFEFDSAGSGAVRITPTAGDPFILTYTGTATGPDRLTGLSATGQYGTTAAAAAIGQAVDALALVEGKPGAVFAKLLTSTGAGTNGSRDTLPASWGLAIDDALVNITALDNLDLGPLAPSSGNFTLTLLVESAIDDALAWFQGWMSAIGMFPTIEQGQITAGAAEDTATATPSFTLEDDEIIECLAHEFWDEGHDPEYQYVTVFSATDSQSSGGTAAATLPTAAELVYDASALVYSNEVNVRQNIEDRVVESAKRVPERLELRVQTLRCMAIGVGSIGELTYTGETRRNGAAGWTAASCLCVAVTPEPSTNTVALTLLVYPATENEND